MKTLLHVLEPKTFPASLIPVVYGSTYGWYRTGHFNLFWFLLLAFSMALIQGTANMVNDYYDHLREADSDKADEKALASGALTLPQLKRFITGCLLICLLIGLYLATQTSPLIFAVAAWGALILFLYSGGPYPLCRSPFGELAAGITMGLGITVTVLYIQTGQVNGEYFFVSIPTVAFIASLLLSNNLADWREDKASGRKTAVILAGVPAATTAWQCLALIQPLLALAFVLLGIFPWPTLILIAILFPWKHLSTYKKAPKERSSKGLLMATSVQVGLRYHGAAVIGLILFGTLLK